MARIIDLRGGIPGEPLPGEATETSDDLVVNVPWIDPERDFERDPDAETTLADVYRGSLDRNVRRVAAVVRTFLDAPAGAVVIHCAAGKDRTGMAVALLLEAAGVPREHVVADYALSEEALGIPAVLADHPGPPDARAYAEEHWRTRPATMVAALRHLDASYGGVVGYLRGSPAALSDDEVGEVRHRLTGRRPRRQLTVGESLAGAHVPDPAVMRWWSIGCGSSAPPGWRVNSGLRSSGLSRTSHGVACSRV